MATTKPLLHPVTANKLQSAIDKPPHALLLVGPEGMGKATVARWLGAQFIQIEPRKLSSYAHYLEITSQEGKAIGIDAIRTIEHFVSLKIPTRSSLVNRLVIIYDAQLLSTEAQNALLKTLEEPPADTAIIVTVTEKEQLLPTIRSRAQSIELTPPATADLQSSLREKGVSEAELATILALSGGMPGLAFALANKDRDHPLVQAAQTARQLLQESSFEKLCRVEALSKDKLATQNVVLILMQMAHAALLTGKNTERWQKVLTTSYNAERAIKSGTQTKLVLTDLMLNL